ASRNSLRVRASSSVKLMRNGAGIGLISGYLTILHLIQTAYLTGFQIEEAEPLLPGLVDKSTNPQVLLQAVLDWTGGQPFLTQKLCKLIATANSCPQSSQEAQWVEQIVNTKILENWEARDTPQHLVTIKDRLIQSDEQQKGKLLGLYQHLLKKGELAANNSVEQMILRLTGIVVKRNSYLKVYNPIYALVFNIEWINQELAKLRPVFYAEALKAWEDSSQQDESRLLTGKALQEVEIWAGDKGLSTQDNEFLKASREYETRIEREAKKTLTEANNQAKRIIRVGISMLIFCRFCQWA
ncbi:MAG: hypothetical protein WBA57_10315, partial [Elainellaceae cyanobacterium]